MPQHAVVELAGVPEPEADATGDIIRRIWARVPSCRSWLDSRQASSYVSASKTSPQAGEVDHVAEAVACDPQGDPGHRGALVQDLVLYLAREVEK